MSSKSKKRNQARKASPAPNVPTKPETVSAPKEESVAIDDAKKTSSQEEFEKIKDKLISGLEGEISTLEDMKKQADQEAQKADENLKQIQNRLDELKKEKEEVEKELKTLKPEAEEAKKLVENANKEAQEIKENAEKASKEIIDNADKEAEAKLDKASKDSAKTATKASEDARKIWEKQAEHITEQLDTLAKERQALLDEKLELEKNKNQYLIDKEELEELRTYIQSRKERYDAANPAMLEKLSKDVEDEKSKYEMLLQKYRDQGAKLNEAMIQLDLVKTEVSESDGTVREMTLKDVVEELHSFREKYNRVVSLNERFSDPDSISKLEEKAQNADKLLLANVELERERNRYREEAQAARNVQRELEVVKQEVDATNALNEHLLQELEAHKTALESRTGDTCPALSKVDTETEEKDFKDKIDQMTGHQELTSLAEIVTHVRNYAGSRKKEEQLYYKENDIRAFLAGMSVSRLLILQGMSGTGKSSLPRIFAEAISGFNRLIPVESSWRDRNELLGYYNDFNKKFNAKSFTIELYRSTKKSCREIPTFIVLDEMNLARIEYYFSDFLAILQEPDREKWLIELVSSDMRTLPMELPADVKAKMKESTPDVYAIWEKIEKSRQGDLKSDTSDDEKEILTAYLAKLGKLTGAKDLIDGRKIHVTDNIWFVGTANRDESTFEISDKVYDRAQVVSLNTKGKKEKYETVQERYISVTDLEKLFKKAQTDYADKNVVEGKLGELDNVLMEEFDVSFGNRIVAQTMDFVAVFVKAGGKMEDALDYQISTKILRKVINSDDEEALLKLLDATKDYQETQRLIEKRLKELR